jgi:hypothetical protein
MAWQGSATALGITRPFSGSTSRLLSLDYTDPMWPLSLPGGDFLAGEGYIELPARKLYLFLVGVGDDSGAGTFNLGPITDCAYQHDPATNRIHLVLPLDDEYQIADGSCSDQIPFEGGGKKGIMTRGTRSWHFTAKRVQP